METIRQNGKTILYSNDGISIKMVSRTLRAGIFKVRNIQTISGISQSAAWDFHPVS